MKNIQWTLDNIFIIIILIVIGYLMAWILHNRKLTKINILQKEAEQINNQNAKNQSEIQLLTQKLHEKEIIESQLETELAYVKKTEQRLSSELTESKVEITQLKEEIIQKKEDNHNIEKQKEVYSIENQTQKEQITEKKQKLIDQQEKYDHLQDSFQLLNN